MTLERVIAVGERTARRLGIHIKLPRTHLVRFMGTPKRKVASHIACRPHASKTPITDAMIEIVNRRVPNDPRGRVVAELLAEAIFREALKGNVKAAKEIADRIEGRVAERTSTDQPNPDVRITAIRPAPVPMAGKPNFEKSESLEVLRSEAS